MFKLFNRKPQTSIPKSMVQKPGASKPIQSPFDERLGMFIYNGFDKIEGGIKKLKLTNRLLTEQNENQAGEIIALKAIVSNLRKQKVYSGQRFYNPKDHKAPVVYLCARWNDWYMIRAQNEATPDIIRAEDWQKEYGHYELMPKPNTNLKNLR